MTQNQANMDQKPLVLVPSPALVKEVSALCQERAQVRESNLAEHVYFATRSLLPDSPEAREFEDMKKALGENVAVQRLTKFVGGEPR